MHCILIERKLEWGGEGSGEKEKGRRGEERWREEREGERELGRNGERRSREEQEIILTGLQLFFGVHDLSLSTPGCTNAKLTSRHKASPLEQIIKLYTVLIVTHVSLQTETWSAILATSLCLQSKVSTVNAIGGEEGKDTQPHVEQRCVHHLYVCLSVLINSVSTARGYVPVL